MLIKYISQFLIISTALVSFNSLSHNANELGENKDILAAAAQSIDIKVGMINNDAKENCYNNQGSCYQAKMILKFPEAMPARWRIQFSNLSPINKVVSDHFSVKHVNGDLHEIQPLHNDFVPGKPYQFIFMGNTPLVSESVFFPNYKLIDTHGHASVIASTTETLLPGHQLMRPQHVLPFKSDEQRLRFAGDQVPIMDAKKRFERDIARMQMLGSALGEKGIISDAERAKNTPKPDVDKHKRIIPKAASTQLIGAQLVLSKGLKLPGKLLTNDALINRFALNKIVLSENGIPIQLIDNKNLPFEAYSLIISDNNISVSSASDAGTFYALMSLAQLYQQDTQSLPIGTINDAPAMPFRGMHLDVSRNFRDKDYVLKLIEQMAYYKLNKLHLHLADDEGWRLQISSLPELTEVGAFRCFDEQEQRCLSPQLAAGVNKTDPNNGYFSINDYIQILQAANERHIEVIPSLDMPGHSRAAIVSMRVRHDQLMAAGKTKEAKQYFLTELADKSEYRSIQHYNDNTLNPCMASTYRFVEEVLSQLISMHKQANVPLRKYHIGADETAGAWQDSPACKAMIAKQASISSVDELGPYFIERVAQKVASLNIQAAAWSDGLSHANANNLPSNVQSNAWATLYAGAHNKVHTMVNKGWDVVLSLPDVMYFDFPYEADPIEPGYYWGSRYTDTYQVFQFMPFNLPAHAEIWLDNYGRQYSSVDGVRLDSDKQIVGIQGQLWSETVRSDLQADYMIFPRLLALAERAWHRPQWAVEYVEGRTFDKKTKHISSEQQQAMQKDWVEFNEVLALQALPQLINDGVNPRVPLPGALLKQNKLHMSTAFSGLALEYRYPNQTWMRYTAPVNIESTVEIRARVENTDVVSRYQYLAF